MRTNLLSTLLLALFIFSGCAGSKEAAKHPLEGMWDYSINTPEGEYTGVISINQTESNLQGYIMGDGLNEEVDLTNLQFMDETLSFSFDSGEYGIIDLTVDVDGDAFDGSLVVPGVGEMPVSGTRQMESM